MRKKREPEVAAIDSVTHDGRGIAAVSGKKVFVSGALPGETVQFMRRKRKRNYDEAELIEVIEAADNRITPRCAVFGTCGGCSLQHLSGADQRTIKQQTLADNLSRIGKVAPEAWLEPIFDTSADGEWHYRRRARLAVKDVDAKGRVLVGFRERHAPYVCDMHRCEVLGNPVAALIDPLSELIGSLSIRRRLPQIEVAIADNATALVFRVLDPPSAADTAALRGFARAYGIEVALQPGGPDSVLPVDPDTPLSTLRYSLAEFDIDIEFGATDFVQVNASVNGRMVSAALARLDLDSKHRVLDLFCGIGNFSLPLARRAGRVLGIEIAAPQVARARANADLNGLDNAEFLAADLSEIDGSEKWWAGGWDRLLLDPARSGAEAVVRHKGIRDVPRIVYVSCHPGTLARDAGILVNEQGFRLEAAGIVDMFPHTGHVESMAVFQKG